MSNRLFALLVTLVAILLAPAAQAGAPEGALARSASSWVDAELSFTQPTLTTMQVDGAFHIYRYAVGSENLDAQEIRERYARVKSSPATAEAFVTSFEDGVRASLSNSLRTSFPGSEITGVTATLDRATLEGASVTPYTPTVDVAVAATVTRPPQATGLGGFDAEDVGAAADSGALITTSLALSSPRGYATAYTIRAPAVPAGLAFKSAQGAEVSADGRSFSVTVDSQRAESPPVSVSATLHNPTVKAPTAEDVRTTIDVFLGTPDGATSTMPITAAVTAELRVVAVKERFPSLLPPNVQLDYLGADGMRALRASGALGDDAIARANHAFLSTIQENLTRTLGSGVTATGGLVGADLSAPPSKPHRTDNPVHFTAAATGDYPLPAGSADKLGMGLDIGATVSFDLDLFGAPRQATTFVLHPVPGAVFSQAVGGGVAVNGATATYTVPAGAGAFPATLSMRGAQAATLTAQDAELGIVVDLKDLDVTIAKAINGDLGNLLMEVTVTGNLGVIEVPESLKGNLLPKNGRVSVDLDYLSSDAIRLLRARGLVSDANLTVLEDKLLADVQGKLGATLGSAVVVTGGFDDASLSADLVSSPLSGEKPIVFRATTSITKPLSGAPAQTGAIALYTQSQTFSLPKLQGLDTTYTVILPRGLAVTDLQASGGEFEVKKSDDGRDAFSVKPTDSTAQATVQMAVTPTFVVLKFWPIVLFAVLLVVLIVGTPVALLMRRRKK